MDEELDRWVGLQADRRILLLHLYLILSNALFVQVLYNEYEHIISGECIPKYSNIIQSNSPQKKKIKKKKQHLHEPNESILVDS